MARLFDMVGSDYWFQGERFQTRRGFFRAQAINKRWWIVDPDNQPFISLGICGIRMEGSPDPEGRMAYREATRRRYGDAKTWAKAQAKRMRRWGFNTVGSWSDPEMFSQGLAYTVMLYMCGMGEGRAAASQLWLHGDFPDVFAEAFCLGAQKAAAELCAPRRDDPWLLGYFLDNELDWNGWRRGTALLDYFLSQGNTAGKRAAVDLLRRRYADDVKALNRSWDVNLTRFNELLDSEGLEPGPQADRMALQADRDDFLRLAANTYFRVCKEAVQAADPNHMTLGVRFAGHADPIVVEECGKYNEIISFNNYSYEPPAERLEEIFKATLRPIMITEWSFKAMDSGLPNTKGAAIPVYTQEDRADGYERYVTQALGLPYVVGLHWFLYADQPPAGRQLDGENSNYGVVDEFDEPYFTLVERMRQVNGRASDIARAAPPLPGL
ncbi:MAG: beta-agarase [Chloroflexi bacterium]|nr:beta-agarase [Chloroflexota bacterium]